jgi:hypothetical protein
MHHERSLETKCAFFEYTFSRGLHIFVGRSNVFTKHSSLSSTFPPKHTQISIAMSVFRIERSSDDHAVYSGFDVGGPRRTPVIQNIHALVSEIEPKLRKLGRDRRHEDYKQDEIRYIQKWNRGLEDDDFCFYFPHLESNYVLKTGNCLLIWYHESLRKLARTEKYVEHDFFAEELVRVEEPIALILQTIESSFRKKYGRYKGKHFRFDLRIYLDDLTGKQTNETGLRFVQIYTCPEKRMGDIFRTLCGNKLKWNYSLSPINGFPPIGSIAMDRECEFDKVWIDRGFIEGFGAAAGYFELGSTLWYNWHRDFEEDESVDSTNWVAVFQEDVRLLCSPFWPNRG